MKLIKFLGLAVVTGIFITMPSMAAEYLIDKPGQHASVNFKVSHLGFSYIIGRFNDFDGSFSYDASNPSASKVSVTIDTRSLDTNHAERDKKLRSETFLDVSKYPTITFESTGYTPGSDGGKLNGDLTIRGVTKAVTIDVNEIGFGADPWGGFRIGFEGNIMLNASDFDIPEWVGDIEVTLIVEGIRQ